MLIKVPKQVEYVVVVLPLITVHMVKTLSQPKWNSNTSTVMHQLTILAPKPMNKMFVSHTN